MRLRTIPLFIKVGFLLLLLLLLMSIWYEQQFLAIFLTLFLFFLAYMYASKLFIQMARMREKLRKSVYYDFNTHLPNRLKFLKDKQRNVLSSEASLIVINIDSFQNTNNFYGHSFGDAFLKVIAQWLLANLPAVEATLYKFEADIYAIFITVPLSEYNLKKYLQKLSLKITKDRIFCEEVEVDTTLSIGAVQAQKNLLKLATIACKEAKKKRVPYCIYDKHSRKEAEYIHNMLMNHTIKEALAKDWVVPFFQPILNLQTHTIEKYETLMRIQKEEGGYYLPHEFLDVSKHSKLYSKLSMSLIQKAFETFQISSNGFSINLSYLDMTNIVTTSFILEKLEEFNVGPWVIFEILESEGIENYDAVLGFIEKVKAYGAKIAIDDFGSGYSNFERISQLRVDYIKIDGSLIKNIDTNEEMKIIAKTIVAFAKELGIKTIAEYVHSAEVLSSVHALGIDYAQGFFIGQPSDSFTVWPK